MDEEKRREYTEALNTYYKLKTAYENAYNKDKNKIIKMAGLQSRVLTIIGKAKQFTRIGNIAR